MSTCKLPIILAYSGFDLTAADGKSSQHISISRFNELLILTVARLSPGRWLNDQLVGMYFAFMQAELFGDQPYLFVPPMVSKLLKDGAANAEEFLVPLGSATKTLIFFAVNNHEGNSQGGEHWNLVVFSKGEKTFFDFDSSRPGNATATRKLVEKLALALNCGQTRLVAVNCRQQMNSFDCGCFVLAHAQWIANHVKAHVTVADVGLLPAGMADAKRAEMQNLIGMMAEIYKQSEDVIEEVIDKKPRQFLLLTDLHPSAPLDFKLDDKMIPHKAIEAAAEKLKMKIAKAPRLSKSPRAFSISTELLREFIAMRINLRMDHDALHAGNILSSSMVQVTLERGTNQKAAYDEFLMASSLFQSFYIF